MSKFSYLQERYWIRSHYQEKASASDFKDSPILRFCHSDAVLSIFSNEHQNVLPVNHQQKCVITGICSTFNIKSNYFGPVIPEKPKKVLKNWVRGRLNAKKIKISKV